MIDPALWGWRFGKPAFWGWTDATTATPLTSGVRILIKDTDIRIFTV